MRAIFKLCLFSFFLLSCTQAALVKGCIQAERNALLDLKAGLVDPTNQLHSWKSENCCSWSGVGCSNKTGQVSKLNLRCPYTNNLDPYDSYISCLSGEISPSLSILSDLEYIDLSGNSFSGTSIPLFIGSFKWLRYLNLSYTQFYGTLPHQLGNLSNLNYLDLAQTSYMPNNIWWLRGLTSLKYLDLSSINFKTTRNWFHVVNTLSSLEVLHLSYCDLPSINESFTHLNLTSLKVLDLAGNALTHLPNWVPNITGIKSLDLSSNSLSGAIPSELSFLSNIEVLLLGGNEFEGAAQNTFHNLCNLNTIDLSRNSLNGTIPEGVWKLPLLTKLMLGNNMFEGTINEVQLGYLKSIKTLDLSNNKLVIQSNNWHPNLGLEYLKLDSCQIGSKFPSWLQELKQLKQLSLSNNGIADTLPQWFWNITHSMYDLDLSNNQIKGKLSLRLLDTNLINLNLSSNLFEGPFPAFSSSSDLYSLDLRNNNIVGSIPFSICEIGSLNVLLLSNNKLSGELPGCQIGNFAILDIANNNLSGTIPGYIFSETTYILKLNNNFFSKVTHVPMLAGSDLEILDLRDNNLSGMIPAWIKRLQNIVFLNLHSNNFSGTIPPWFDQLSHLQILDLSHNSLSGVIPTEIGNLNMMQKSSSYDGSYGFNEENFIDSFYYSYMVLRIKNENRIYFSQTLSLMTSIDISNNNLSGEIPPALGDLEGLHNLNLSENHLSGIIPETIGKMKSLESLDLSMNNLSGIIPQTLSELASLSLLNLSYNNLSGMIPTGTQLQTLNDASIYAGNPFLCGPPISKKCTTGHNKTVNNGDANVEDGFEWLWLYICTICGFIVGFWSLYGALILNRDWRYAYINMIDALIDQVYVAGALLPARIMRKFREVRRLYVKCRN